jgi:hypothetical protein
MLSLTHTTQNSLQSMALELAKIFNKFYHECKVLGSDAEAERTALVEASRSILEQRSHLVSYRCARKRCNSFRFSSLFHRVLLLSLGMSASSQGHFSQ